MPFADRAVKLAMTLVVALLAAMSFTVSYRHAYALALSLGEDPATSRMIPLTIDLMLLGSALAGLFCSRYSIPQPRLARAALFLGIGATISVNVAEGLSRGILAAVFDGWPAVALVISSELMLWVVAASRSLEKRSIVVVEHEEEADAELDAAVELFAKDRTLTAAALGRKMGIAYPKALELAKRAKAVVNVAY